MNKGAGIGIGIFLILLLVGGLFAYSYTQLSVSLNDVKFHSIDWTSLSWSNLLKLGLNTLTGNWLGAAFDLIDGVNLNLFFGLTNNGFLPVYIPDLSYEILINDISIGRGYSDVEVTINPGQTKEIISFQNIKKSSLSPAVYSIVGANGMMDLKVKGTAYFQLFGMGIPVPFESSKQISIYDEIRNKLNEIIQKNQQQQRASSTTSSLGKTLDAITNELFGSEDLNLSLPGKSLIDSTYKVGPGSYTYFDLNFSCTVNLQGGFIASAALGDNIYVYIVDESRFRQFENGQSVSTYYNSGKIESDTFDVTLSQGTYYIILSNLHSDFSTKTVQLQASARCI